MLNSNEKKISAKALKAALGIIKDLSEAAAEVSAIYHTYQVMVEETGIPADSQMMEECSQIFQTVNRMILKEQADLTHRLQMKAAMKRSDECLKEFRQKMTALKAGKVQENTLFTQAAS